MKRTLGVCALLVLAAMTTACGFNIFEDVGSDPHPPTVEITALVHLRRGRWNDDAGGGMRTGPSRRRRHGPSSGTRGGSPLSLGQKFQIGIAYTDAGGDIERVPPPRP